MKKLLLGFGAATAVITPITAVVACGKKEKESEPVMPTNGNKIATSIIAAATLNGKVVISGTKIAAIYKFEILDSGKTKQVIVSVERDVDEKNNAKYKMTVTTGTTAKQYTSVKAMKTFKLLLEDKKLKAALETMWKK